MSVEIDETVPLGRHLVASVQPAVLRVEGGALEDSTQPRQFSVTGATDVLGRLLLELGDRLDPVFGAPAIDEPLSLPQRSAWDVYNAGRLDRSGHPAQQQRWRYAFRTRHGFSDVADRVFSELWEAERLSWAELVERSDVALGPAAA